MTDSIEKLPAFCHVQGNIYEKAETFLKSKAKEKQSG